MSDPASKSDVVLGLAEEFLERHRRGERPSLKEYLDRYPELADRIRAVFPVMAIMERIAFVDESLAAEHIGAGAPLADLIPSLGQLGDFRIIREIGRGGMGVVYEAEQVSLGRHVALKLLPQPALAGSSNLQRFRLEARAAARLHHTNIVPVFGVGEQDGLHYYAMQFIPGQGLDAVFAKLRAGASPEATVTVTAIHDLLRGQFPAAEPSGETGSTDRPSADTGPIIDSDRAGGEYLDRGLEPSSKALAVGGSSLLEPSGSPAEPPYYRSIARVGLQVAEAMAYAHSQGILHRDIKPSNLLLDDKGTVWVTDFGLAKAEGSDALTQTGDVVGTLRYMAPERFDGWSDPRSDIYSLGVTLYELLTLRPLFEEPNRALLIKRVTQELPPAPRKLQPKIPRDLETIVLKAITKEPAQRYASSEEMAEDLRRFLADRPIKARRTSEAERLWRWSRRNPALAVSLSSLFLVLAVGCTGMTVLWLRAESQRAIAARLRDLSDARLNEAERQRARAQANFDRARAAVDDSLGHISESQLKSVPGLQPLRRELLSSALRFYEDFVKERGDDPTLKAGLAAAQLRLAKIQHEIGAEPQAQLTLRQATTLYETASHDRPDDRGLRDGLAQCCVQLGIAQMPFDQALGQFERAITLWQALRQAEPSSAVYQRELANTYNLIAVLHDKRSRLAESLRAHQQAFALRRALVAAHPDDPSFQNALAATLNNIGVLLDKTSVESRETLAMFRRAVEHSRIACGAAPEVVQYGRFLIAELRNVGASEYDLGNADRALDAFRNSLEVSRRLVRENPAILSLRRELFQDYGSVGDINRAQGREAEAVRTYRQATELLDAVPRETGQDYFNLACFLALCARPANEPGSAPSDLEQAERRRNADAAMAALRQATIAGYRNAVALKLCEELDALRQRDDFKATVAEVESAGPLPAAERLTSAPRGPSSALPEALAAPIIAAAGPARPREEDTQPAAQHAIGVVQVELARLEEAKTTLDQALAARQALVRDNPGNARYRADVASTRVALGRLAWKDGRLAEAVSRWQEIRHLLESAIEETPSEPVFTQQLVQSEVVIAQSYAEKALWDEAAEAMERAFRHGLEERNAAVRRMSLLAVMRQRDTLPRLGAKILHRYGKNGDPIVAGELARCCALAAGVVPDADWLVTLAQRAAVLGQTGPLQSFNLSLAEYRARRYEDAVHDARESLASATGGETGALGALNGALLAMAHFRLGRHEEARRWLDKVDCLDWRSIGQWPTAEAWWQRSDFLVLKREAVELITGKPAPDDPWLREERGHAYALLGEAAKAEAELQAACAARPEPSSTRHSQPSR
jgi:serine/threonine protein kinase/tetratricopeptide (TPR) repeat protein